MGKINLNFPLTSVKTEILVYKYSISNIFLTVQNIMVVSIYKSLYNLSMNITCTQLGQNILEKFNYDKIKYRVKLIQILIEYTPLID